MTRVAGVQSELSSGRWCINYEELLREEDKANYRLPLQSNEVGKKLDCESCYIPWWFVFWRCKQTENIKLPDFGGLHCMICGQWQDLRKHVKLSQRRFRLRYQKKVFHPEGWAGSPGKSQHQPDRVEDVFGQYSCAYVSWDVHVGPGVELSDPDGALPTQHILLLWFCDWQLKVLPVSS